MGNFTVFHKSNLSIQNYLLKNLINLLLREKNGGAYHKETVTGVSVAYLIPCSLQCRYTLSYKDRGWKCVVSFAVNIAKEISRLFLESWLQGIA